MAEFCSATVRSSDRFRGYFVSGIHTARLGKATKEEKRRVKDLERELARKDRALAETAALLVLRKKASAIWGDGELRMISTPDRQTAIALINEAITAGARRAKACAALEISDRTLRRWTKGGQVRPDQRPLVPRPEPANKLSEAVTRCRAGGL